MKVYLSNFCRVCKPQNRYLSGNTKFPSSIQRLALVPYYALGSFVNPNDGKFIAGLSDLTSVNALKRLQSHLRSSTKGRDLLLQKPTIDSSSIDLKILDKYESNTFGKKYAEFMQLYHFSVDDRTPVIYKEDDELAYILNRYRQIHDFWHVLVELPTSILGEISLKSFEWYITGIPSCYLAMTVGSMKLSMKDRYQLRNKYIPWSYDAAKSCSRDILSFRYENYFHLPIDQIRKELNLLIAPK